MKIHMVKQGDSLYLIAKKYDVPLEEIIKANPDISNPDAIEVGMKVKVPSHPKTALGIIHQHIVQQGDTLWKLSKSWGIHLADLIKANPQLKNPNALLTGEVVNIPKTTGGSDATGVAMHGSGPHGKANTGTKPGTGTKADTNVQPLPTPVPAPAPVIPTPAPQPVAPAPVMPVAETKPIYGMHEHHDLFNQYPMPSVQATMPEQIAPMGYGYGMPATMPEQMAPMGHGYGMQQPVAGTHGMEGGYGYGYPMGISPLGGHIGGDIGGLYTHQDYSYSPPQANAGIPGVSYGNAPQVSGCKTCGAPKWPTLDANAAAAAYGEAYPGMGYAPERIPYGISPYSVGPYANAPQAVSPAGQFPGTQYNPYANAPQAVSPAGQLPGTQYNPYPNAPQAVSPAGQFPGTQYNPYYGSQMGDIPVGVNSLATGGPGTGYGAPVEPYYYGGGFPPIPPMPPMPPLRPLDPQRDSEDDLRSDFGEDEGSLKISTAKKRQAKPKAKVAIRQSKPKRKESLPWIKW